MCSEPGLALCSSKCRRLAQEEIAANRSRLLTGRLTAYQRRALAARNGDLTAALIGWRP